MTRRDFLMKWLLYAAVTLLLVLLLILMDERTDPALILALLYVIL